MEHYVPPPSDGLSDGATDKRGSVPPQSRDVGLSLQEVDGKAKWQRSRLRRLNI